MKLFELCGDDHSETVADFKDHYDKATDEMISRVKSGESHEEVIRDLSRKFASMHNDSYDMFSIMSDGLKKRHWEMGFEAEKEENEPTPIAISVAPADDSVSPDFKKKDSTATTEEIGPGFAVRYSLDGKRKVQAYKTEKDAQHRAEILRSMGGVKDVSITTHTLNFKKESSLAQVGKNPIQKYKDDDKKYKIGLGAKRPKNAKEPYIKSKKEEEINERMPASIIKHKEKLAYMTDKELADRLGSFDETNLRQMAWRHGYGKMSSHYWDRVQAGKKEASDLSKYKVGDMVGGQLASRENWNWYSISSLDDGTMWATDNDGSEHEINPADIEMHERDGKEVDIKQENAGDGMQPADLKRMGLTRNKVYVHKDGKTIMVDKSIVRDMLKVGWKLSPLRVDNNKFSQAIQKVNPFKSDDQKKLQMAKELEKNQPNLVRHTPGDIAGETLPNGRRKFYRKVNGVNTRVDIYKDIWPDDQEEGLDEKPFSKTSKALNTLGSLVGSRSAQGRLNIGAEANKIFQSWKEYQGQDTGLVGKMLGKNTKVDDIWKNYKGWLGTVGTEASPEAARKWFNATYKMDFENPEKSFGSQGEISKPELSKLIQGDIANPEKVINFFRSKHGLDIDNTDLAHIKANPDQAIMTALKKAIAGNKATVPGAPAGGAGTTPELKKGDTKQGSDGNDYTWQGAQWISNATGRIATVNIADELGGQKSASAGAEDPRATLAHIQKIHPEADANTLKAMKAMKTMQDTGKGTLPPNLQQSVMPLVNKVGAAMADPSRRALLIKAMDGGNPRESVIAMQPYVKVLSEILKDSQLGSGFKDIVKRSNERIKPVGNVPTANNNEAKKIQLSYAESKFGSGFYDKIIKIVSEGIDKDDLAKLDYLARQGLVPRSKVARFKTAMRTLSSGRDLSITYKNTVVDVVVKLASIITKPGIMQMVRQKLRPIKVKKVGKVK